LVVHIQRSAVCPVTWEGRGVETGRVLAWSGRCKGKEIGGVDEREKGVLILVLLGTLPSVQTSGYQTRSRQSLRDAAPVTACIIMPCQPLSKIHPPLTNHSSPYPTARMSANPSSDSPDLQKNPLTEVVEDVPPPAYNVHDVEAAIAQSATSPKSQPESRTKTFLLTTLYTVIFAIAAVIFGLRGSWTIGFGYDEELAAYARSTYAGIIGSIILGPIFFTNRRFRGYMGARKEAINIHIANGRLIKALGNSLLYFAVVTGAAAFAAALGYGLMFWPLEYSDSLSTEKMVVRAILIPVACLFGGFRWTCEMVSMAMWILIRAPRISAGLEGEKYERLIKIVCALPVSCVFFF